MHTEVAALQGLAVNTHAEIGTVHAAYCDNSVEGLVVKDCDHEGEQNLFKAADEPKIFGKGFVVGADEVGDRWEGVVAHPLGLYQLLVGLK